MNTSISKKNPVVDLYRCPPPMGWLAVWLRGWLNDARLIDRSIDWWTSWFALRLLDYGRRTTVQIHHRIFFRIYFFVIFIEDFSRQDFAGWGGSVLFSSSHDWRVGLFFVCWISRRSSRQNHHRTSVSGATRVISTFSHLHTITIEHMMPLPPSSPCSLSSSSSFTSDCCEYHCHCCCRWVDGSPNVTTIYGILFITAVAQATVMPIAAIIAIPRIYYLNSLYQFCDDDYFEECYLCVWSSAALLSWFILVSFTLMLFYSSS